MDRRCLRHVGGNFGASHVACANAPGRTGTITRVAFGCGLGSTVSAWQGPRSLIDPIPRSDRLLCYKIQQNPCLVGQYPRRFSLLTVPVTH